MMDTHETNLPAEETGKLEETKAPVTTPEKAAEEVVTNETPEAEVVAEEAPAAAVSTDETAAGEEAATAAGKLSKEEILEKLTGLVAAAADATRNEVEALKQAYYKIHRSEVDELKKAFWKTEVKKRISLHPKMKQRTRSRNYLPPIKKSGLLSLQKKNG